MSASIIAVMNPKGGAGKTTLATNLARALELLGNRVLLADTDPQGTSRKWSAVDTESVEMTPVLGVGQSTLAQELSKISGSFDYIVIDGAAKLEAKQMVPALKAADIILIPVQPSLADIWEAVDLVDLIEARREAGAQLHAAFVVSRQIVGSGLSEDVGEILSEQGVPTLRGRTSQRVAYAEALSAGFSVFEHDRDGKARGEIAMITEEVLEILNGKKEPAR